MEEHWMVVGADILRRLGPAILGRSGRVELIQARRGTLGMVAESVQCAPILQMKLSLRLRSDQN